MTAPSLHRPAWLDDFTIPASAAGVVLAFDFGDEGLWSARLDRDRNVVETVLESRITPGVLDVRTASYLRDSEIVPNADQPEVFAELTDVCRRARGVLIERDSVLLMGVEHLRLVTVSLDTAMAATMPEVNRAHGMIVELAGREPVAAVFLGPGTDAWPGLWESLTARGFTMLLPGDAFPPTFGGDNRETDVLESVDEAPTSLAWAAESQRAPIGLPAEAPAAPPVRRLIRHRRQALGTAAALAAVAIAGTAVAVAAVNDDDDSKTDLLATTGTSDQSAGIQPTTAASPTTVEPADLRAARAQMKRYTPPTSSASSTTSEARPGPQPRPRQRVIPRRTIPNPIPGLPPIVIG